MNYRIIITLAFVFGSTLWFWSATPTSNAKFLKPAEAIKKMTVPEGFEVTAFVAEPDIGECIAFCFDDRGRLWTLENFNYQTRRAHSKDQRNRIQIFEDVNGDGVFDTKKLFTDKLTFSSGIAVGMGGVYVGKPPELIFIPDADGDDKPDGDPKVLLDGWGIQDRHETLNSFIWGPDGWLYGCHGVFTRSEVGKPGAPKSERKYIDGGIWRWHPVSEEFEVFAEGLSNPWGFDFNDHGQGFATCCVIPHLFHIVQGGVYHKQSKQNVNRFVYDNIKTIRDSRHNWVGSAHGGARFYLADTFPKRYRNQLFMCNIHRHSVLTDYMVPRGSSFIGKHGGNFLPANDLAWVGFSVEMGPEGGVYILDWHDQNICGNEITFPNSSRVYRIMPENSKPVERPNLRSLSDLELVEMQKHSNDWYVRHARVILHHRAIVGKLDASKVHLKLEEMLSQAKTQAKRLRALWALHVTGGLKAKEGSRMIELLSHSDEYVRAWSIQFLCEDKKPSLKALDKFNDLAKSDKSPVVRLYLAAALQRLPFEQRWSILEALAAHEEDVEDHNIPRMLWLALEPMVPENQEKALTLALSSKMPKLQEFVPRRILGQVSAPVRKKPWQNVIKKVAPGFSVRNVGEGGVVHHSAFRNRSAVQTHPLKRGVPSELNREFDVPKNKKTILSIVVSHHPHGDWLLRVKVNGKVVSETPVSSKTAQNEWLTHTVDLSRYAGKKIKLQLENQPSGWRNEWAYWNEVKIISSPDTK